MIASVNQCVRSEKNLFISSENYDIVPFDVADIFIDKIIKKTECAIKTIKPLMTEPKMKELYDEFKPLAEAFLQNDMKKCSETKDIDKKLR